jgi:hypothetical protein
LRSPSPGKLFLSFRLLREQQRVLSTVNWVTIAELAILKPPRTGYFFQFTSRVL